MATGDEGYNPLHALTFEEPEIAVKPPPKAEEQDEELPISGMQLFRTLSECQEMLFLATERVRRQRNATSSVDSEVEEVLYTYAQVLRHMGNNEYNVSISRRQGVSRNLIIVLTHRQTRQQLRVEIAGGMPR